MRLGVSVVSETRGFSKAMFRIRPVIEILKERFGELQWNDPIHEALLVGLTDSRSESQLEVLPNKDGVFQVLIGVGRYVSEEHGDGDLIRKVKLALGAAVGEIPFSIPDKRVASEFCLIYLGSGVDA